MSDPTPPQDDERPTTPEYQAPLAEDIDTTHVPAEASAGVGGSNTVG